eukprot:gene11660-4897_t
MEETLELLFGSSNEPNPIKEEPQIITLTPPKNKLSLKRRIEEISDLQEPKKQKTHLTMYSSEEEEEEEPNKNINMTTPEFDEDPVLKQLFGDTVDEYPKEQEERTDFWNSNLFSSQTLDDVDTDEFDTSSDEEEIPVPPEPKKQSKMKEKADESLDYHQCWKVVKKKETEFPKTKLNLPSVIDTKSVEEEERRDKTDNDNFDGVFDNLDYILEYLNYSNVTIGCFEMKKAILKKIFGGKNMRFFDEKYYKMMDLIRNKKYQNE